MVILDAETAPDAPNRLISRGNALMHGVLGYVPDALLTTVKHQLISNRFPILQHLQPFTLYCHSITQSIMRRRQLRHPESLPFFLYFFPVLPSLLRLPAPALSCLLPQSETLNHIPIRRFSCGRNRRSGESTGVTIAVSFVVLM